jgi:hypothetical protein
MPNIGVADFRQAPDDIVDSIGRGEGGVVAAAGSE